MLIYFTVSVVEPGLYPALISEITERINHYKLTYKSPHLQSELYHLLEFLRLSLKPVTITNCFLSIHSIKSNVSFAKEQYTVHKIIPQLMPCVAVMRWEGVLS